MISLDKKYFKAIKTGNLILKDNNYRRNVNLGLISSFAIMTLYFFIFDKILICILGFISMMLLELGYLYETCSFCRLETNSDLIFFRFLRKPKLIQSSQIIKVIIERGLPGTFICYIKFFFKDKGEITIPLAAGEKSFINFSFELKKLCNDVIVII